MTPEAVPILEAERPTAEPVVVPGVPRLRRAHLLLGFFIVLCFLGTGTYLLILVSGTAAVDLGQRVALRSRHIYILCSAIANLLLGAYLVPAATRRRRFLQGLGSALLMVSSVLLFTAFFIDPYRSELMSGWSSLGVILMLAGALLHVGAGRRTL